MSTTRVSEYDAFGPWVDEVSVPEDVPRLFRDHALDLDTARLVLKVPRDIARRDASPDMDLYDYLLILDSSCLTVLKRHGAGLPGRAEAGPRGYDTMTVPFEQVVAIRDVVNLLDATVTISTSTGATIPVRYNGSARANVNRLVDELRAVATVDPPGAVGQALLAAAPTVRGGTVRLELGAADLALVSSFDKLSRSHPDALAWTCHGRRTLTPPPDGLRGLVQRSLHVLSPMTLHGGVLASDGRALEVLGRAEWLVRGRTPDHSTSRLVVPLASLERLTVASHPTYPEATVATITAGGAAIELVVPTRSEAHRILSAAATTAYAS